MLADGDASFIESLVGWRCRVAWRRSLRWAAVVAWHLTDVKGYLWAKPLGAQTMCSSMCRRSGSSPSLARVPRRSVSSQSQSHGAEGSAPSTGGELNITLDTLVEVARGLGTTVEALRRRAKL